MGDPPSPGLQSRLVRSFTDELKDRNVLEKSTKYAQKHHDAEHEKNRNARLEAYFEDPQSASKGFDAADTVRSELQRACNEFFKNQKPRHTWLGASTAEKLESRMATMEFHDLDDVKMLVEMLQGEWQNNHGKAYRCFECVCGSLQAHKDIFAILPVENTYAKTLCGALSLIVQASVSHKSVAEFLPGQIAKLSDAAIICKSYTDIVETEEMQRLFASLYKSLFSFLLKVATWYLKSRVGRMMSSFSSTLMEDYKQAASDIEYIVSQFRDKANVANLAMSRVTLNVAKDIRAKPDPNPNMLVIGDNMLETLKSLSENAPKILQLLSQQQLQQEALPPYTAQPTGIDGHSHHLISRDDAARRIEDVPLPRCGSDGLLMSQERHIFLSDSEAVTGLSKWTQRSIQGPALLWITTVEGLPGTHSIAEVAALGVITMALRAEALFISFCCGTPLKHSPGGGATPEQIGLLSMVYSLISQLLQFRPAEDKAQVTEDLMSCMDGSKTSWESALSMLEDLLAHTPSLRYCVIHNLNALETGGARPWVRRFLGVLVARFGSADSMVSLLFTTSGQSLELSATVPKEYTLLLDTHFGKSTEFGEDPGVEDCM